MEKVGRFEVIRPSRKDEGNVQARKLVSFLLEPLVVTKLSCTSCDVQLEGQFDIPGLISLEPADLEFILNFVRASGSIKEMSKIEGVSYPTLRARLNALIERLDAVGDRREVKQNEILDKVAAGEISAVEAAALLKELSK